MLVSWNWLQDYVQLDMHPDVLVERLSMAGLNHESTEEVGDDLSIDLEVTSNRPDCLGHIGVAREISVLWQSDLKIPRASPQESATQAADLTNVTIDCTELCYRYTARVIRGARIGPSPEWLIKRLRAIFRKRTKDNQIEEYQPINNVVDITNYVLMESGQPLHAFDFDMLRGQKIIVREAKSGEEFEAIDHHTYQLEPGMCVIADAEVPVALGGVMGGAATEVSESTTDLLIESAQFAPTSIRNTARKLNLHSPSSYRFERGVDPLGVDWASRRCCELILELAGGELADGVVDVGREIAKRKPIVLRLSQLPRVLGITVSGEEVSRILTALGCDRQQGTKSDSVSVTPPSWRRDLSREIDLVEEIARVHGYDAIPEDVAVPMVPSHRSDKDRVLAKVRAVLTSAGFDEAMTTSVVPEQWSTAFSPWTNKAPIVCDTPVLRGADRLRTSLVPSLLESRRINESLSNPEIELFETAKIYLPTGTGLPDEPLMLAITSGAEFVSVKGVVEAIVASLNPMARLDAVDTRHLLLDTMKSAELRIGDETLGFLGELTSAALKRFGLRSPTTVAEVNFSVLNAQAVLIPQHTSQSPFPAIARDLNLVVDETVRWSRIADAVTAAGGELLEEVRYRDTFRAPDKDGSGKKRLFFSVTFRSPNRTLTGDQADALRQQIVDSCRKTCGATLLA